MPKVVLPIASGFYVDDSLPVSAQECTNWYPSIIETQALSQEILRGTPGIVEVVRTGEVNQENRGAHVFEDIPYFVNGGLLYRLMKTVVGEEEQYTEEALGTIAGEGRVFMEDNGTQLCILVPGNPSTGYIFTVDPDNLQEITDPDFKANGEPQAMVFVDGYFLFTTDSKKFIISALNDGLSYLATDVGTAESDPDPIVAPVVFKNQVFMGGSETTEAFENVGGSGFPFRRTGLYISKGISAPFSVVRTSQTFMFLGAGVNETPAIWVLSGNDVEKISTIAIDTILQDLTEEEVSEVFAWAYGARGAYFVGFALPNTTLVYDLMSKRWHERKSRRVNVLNVTVTERWRVNSIVQAYGENFVGDAIDGRIGVLEKDVFKEYGSPIIRRITTQPFQNNMESFLVPSIELTVESGVGNPDVPDPRIMMERSLDGKIWKDGRLRRIGKVGEYGARAIWRMNGRAARFELFRFTLSEPCKPVIIQLTADIEAGE